MSAINVSEIPTLIGNFIGLPPLLASTIIAVALTVAVLVALSILKVKTIGLAVGGVGVLAVFTILQWFDPWIFAIIALIAAVMIGNWVSKSARSGEG